MRSNRKEIQMLTALLGLQAMASGAPDIFGIMDEPRHHFKEPQPIKKVIPNACAEYSFYGFTVIAISEKSARKKCAKLKDKQQ